MADNNHYIITLYRVIDVFTQTHIFNIISHSHTCQLWSLHCIEWLMFSHRHTYSTSFLTVTPASCDHYIVSSDWCFHTDTHIQHHFSQSHLPAVIVAAESFQVARLEMVTRSSTAVHLRWSPPTSSNARVQFYLLSYRELEPLACMTGPAPWSPFIDVDADRRELDLPSLLPHCKYEVTLSAYTVAGRGRARVAVATTDAAGDMTVIWVTAICICADV